MVAAVGSWLDARASGGRWLLRIDDLDAPRVARGAVDSIQRCLDDYGLHWDGEVIRQSARFEAYEAALEQLTKMGMTFPCACTRKELELHEVYPGTCRDRTDVEPRSIRLRCGAGEVSWHDAGLGARRYTLRSAVGDVILRNAHNMYSYHLANVVDDMAYHVTHVVRGADLELATAAHVHLQEVLGGQTVAYHHLPLALDANGDKLSKQTKAAPVEASEAVPVLHRVFAHLNLPAVTGESPEALLQLQLDNWRINASAQFNAGSSDRSIESFD